MLGWLTGVQRLETSENTKILEPPETPAPVFAIRAFKTALFGTPGVDGDEDDAKSRPVGLSAVTNRKSQVAHGDKSRALLDGVTDRLVNLEKRRSLPSPTKSILVTPGTNAAQRKTVSFGEGVFDKERSNTGNPQTTSGLSHDFPGKWPSPWTGRKAGSRCQGKSKLTQSLINARDNTDSENQDLKQDAHYVGVKKDSHPPQSITSAQAEKETEEVDVTVNLNEPRSQSGKYWKSEYEAFELKTSREIKKLIQYRHIAKSYAKKKDAEALRLAEKLRLEEAKVGRMERKVKVLAAKMAGGREQQDGEMDAEGLVKELAQQTAMAVQYKQKVDRLREEMEAHNVMSEGSLEGVAGFEEISRRLRAKENELENAHAKIAELTAENGEVGKLQMLVQTTESKVSRLAKDNELLKSSLTKVKEEMSHSEDRRKMKEEKLRERESKLEARNREHQARIAKMALDRQEQESTLLKRFNLEKTKLLEQIASLQALQERGIPDFRNIQSQKVNPVTSGSINYGSHSHPSKSPKRSRPVEPLVDIWAAEDCEPDLLLEDDPIVLTDMYNVVEGQQTSSPNMVFQPHRPVQSAPLLRSSPKVAPLSRAVSMRDTCSSQPSMVTISNATKYSTFPAPLSRANTARPRIDHVTDSSAILGSRISSATGVSKKGLPPDRIAAAKARLQQKKEGKKKLENDKENLERWVS